MSDCVCGALDPAWLGVFARRRERERQRHDQQQQAGEDQQRLLPADAADQRRRRTARTGTGRTSRPPCRRRSRACGSARRQQLAERRDHEIERAARKAEADQHAGGDLQRDRRGRVGHQREAGRIEHRADAQHPQHAEAVRDRAGEGLRRCPTAGSAARRRARTRRGPSRSPADIGVRKKPKAERGPNPSSEIRQPQRMMTSGRPPADRARRCSHLRHWEVRGSRRRSASADARCGSCH